MNTRSICSFLSIILLAAAVGGCANMQEDSTTFIRMAPTAPPEPFFEEKDQPENPAAEIWRPGYWGYSGIDFFWVEGEYIPRPDPTAVWSPDRWQLRSYGWAFVPGYWE
ncbi:MAG: hypothetical protein PHX43_05535 [Alphaproteobacteria bacterium]|nr:hypothetical protein [Alphaproteobacteria bacterium]